MAFVIGFIAGVLTVGVIVVTELYLYLRKDSLTEKVLQTIRGSPQAQIVDAPTREQAALEKLTHFTEDFKIE